MAARRRLAPARSVRSPGPAQEPQRRPPYGRNPLLAAHGVRARAEIVEAARDLFTRNGYQATTVEAIGEATGRSGAAVYQYFSGKFEIFAMFLREFGVELRRVAQQFPLLTVGDAGRQSLRDWIVQMMDARRAPFGHDPELVPGAPRAGTGQPGSGQLPQLSDRRHGPARAGRRAPTDTECGTGRHHVGRPVEHPAQRSANRAGRPPGARRRARADAARVPVRDGRPRPARPTTSDAPVTACRRSRSATRSACAGR